MENGKRVCTDCGIEKDLDKSNFPFNKKGDKIWFERRCSKCKYQKTKNSEAYKKRIAARYFSDAALKYYYNRTRSRILPDYHNCRITLSSGEIINIKRDVTDEESIKLKKDGYAFIFK
jgi:hypothetical protein